MSKTEIMAELARLPEEDLEEVREWLERRTIGRPRSTGIGSMRIRSPKLADPARSPDFVKVVTEARTDDSL